MGYTVRVLTINSSINIVLRFLHMTLPLGVRWDYAYLFQWVHQPLFYSGAAAAKVLSREKWGKRQMVTTTVCPAGYPPTYFYFKKYMPSH